MTSFGSLVLKLKTTRENGFGWFAFAWINMATSLYCQTIVWNLWLFWTSTVNVHTPVKNGQDRQEFIGDMSLYSTFLMTNTFQNNVIYDSRNFPSVWLFFLGVWMISRIGTVVDILSYRCDFSENTLYSSCIYQSILHWMWPVTLLKCFL